MTLRPHDVDEIVQIGMERAPHEACGILLDRTDGKKRLLEIPNAAPNPINESGYDVETFLDALALLGKGVDGDLTPLVVLWHTHPHGKVGPSDRDLEGRQAYKGLKCAVVTIPSGEMRVY